jgi:hypothetical protein
LVFDPRRQNTNFDDAKLVVPAADLDSWTFQARDEGPDEGTKQQNRSEIGLDGVQRRRKDDPRRGSKTWHPSSPRVSKTMSGLKVIDFFRKIPADLTEATVVRVISQQRS